MNIFFTSLLPIKELTQQTLPLPSDLGSCSNCVLKNTSSVKCAQELCERKCCPSQIHFGNTVINQAKQFSQL